MKSIPKLKLNDAVNKGNLYNQQMTALFRQFSKQVPRLTLPIEFPSIDSQAFTFPYNGRSISVKFDHFDGNFNKQFNFLGQVIKGQQLGRQWGIPTANIDAEHMYPFLQGIFCVKIQRKDGECYHSVASIGNRPTVKGIAHLLEVHIFNFSGDLYNETLNITFLQKLRDEIKFSSIEKLIKQIHNDIYKAHILLPELETYQHNPLY